MKQQVLTVADRKAILDRQGPLWADDEIAWALSQFASPVPPTHECRCH